MDNLYLIFFKPIWSHKGFTVEEKLILNFVWNFQQKSGECYASNDYIATCFGMRVDRVKTLIAELESVGYINTWEEADRRYMTCNLTRLEDVCGVDEDLFRDFSY